MKVKVAMNDMYYDEKVRNFNTMRWVSTRHSVQNQGVIRWEKQNK
jgi:hypothetical protein